MGDEKNLSQYEYNKVPDTEKLPEKVDSPPKFGYGVRHIQLVIFFLCLTVCIIGRGHLGVTIVAMTHNPELSITTDNTSIYLKKNNDTNLTNHSNTGETEKAFEDFKTSNGSHEIAMSNSNPEHKTWIWPKSIQEMVLNSFFLGYMIMMFPMGMVCQRYGGKLPLQIGLFVTGIASIITPWLAIWGDWKAVCGCRIVQGLAQAGTYPSIQSLLAKWVPEDERASLGSCVHTGLTLGTVIAFQLAGFLGASKWGWPSTYYVVGVICMLCFIVLTVFGAANPLEHKSISQEEKNYIMRAANKGNGKKLATPWRAIFTSKPLWGTIITHVGTSLTFIFFFNQVPTYIHYILDIDVRNSGMLSSLPYVASIFTSLFFGWLADYSANNNIISKNNTRRISDSVASFGMAICLILTSYTSNSVIAVSCLVVAMAINMGHNTGWMVNYIDLAPNFAGTLLAVGNTIANIFGVLSPIVVSYVVIDMTNITQWRIMFFIASGISIVTNVIFVLMMSTDVQPFNYASTDETCVEDMQGEFKEKKKAFDVL
ncbi:unnamed protein product [Arctia plantaginis]|uniref:Major facilitator superfamily (MFS) profile domain-containing protein n=1 Tax=Arctia plantaginis TaxID=874455 RepID=A0A8S1BG72_ARCPL|nr:unnamed protein product [Arctia plantaginis]CAB3257143.1 unnamed protein product [Arctia plantaginis]